MGGGIPLIEANRIGCDVYGFDINPMSAWIVREEIEHLDMDAYEQEAAKLLKTLRAEIEDLYHTDCPLYGDTSRARVPAGATSSWRVGRQTSCWSPWPIRQPASPGHCSDTSVSTDRRTPDQMG